MGDHLSTLSLSGVRVLLVEDDEDTRVLYAMALEQAGAEVRAAADAKEAVRALLEWTPSVVVSDLMMPGSDGYSLLREVRTMHHATPIPAIAVTGRSGPKDREAVLAAGFQEHAVKPLTPDALIAIVKRWAAG